MNDDHKLNIIVDKLKDKIIEDIKINKSIITSDQNKRIYDILQQYIYNLFNGYDHKKDEFYDKFKTQRFKNLRRSEYDSLDGSVASVP